MQLMKFSSHSRFNFLKAVWNNIKDDRNRESIFQDPNVTKETSPYPEWTKLVILFNLDWCQLVSIRFELRFS